MEKSTASQTRELHVDICEPAHVADGPLLILAQDRDRAGVLPTEIAS